MADSLEAVRIAHLTMIQGVVTRMATNSFTLKTLAISFAGAWTAFMAATSSYSPVYIAAAVVPIVGFWILDSQFLRLERLYRRLYEEVRKGAGIEAFSMDFKPFSKDVSSVVRTAISWSIVAYYLPLTGAVIALGLWLMQGEPRA